MDKKPVEIYSIGLLTASHSNHPKIMMKNTNNSSFKQISKAIS
jgi:hypothetical protein